MQRNTLIVFLLLALGLGAYVYFYEIRGEADRQAAKDAEKQLFKLTRDDVSALTITNAHGAFTVTRQETQWSLTAPIQAPADTRAVEDVIFAMDALRYSKTVEGKTGDLTPFGLASPRFKVTATTREGDRTLLVGDEAPFGGELYVMKEGDPAIYLTTYPLKERLEKDLLGWRDKKILDFTVADVQRLEVRGEGLEGLDLKKEGDRWVTASQPPLRLDASQVESLLYDLQGLTTRGFTGQTDLPLFGLEPPKLTVALELGTDRTRKQLRFGAPYGEEGRLPVIRDQGDEVRLVDASIREKLLKPVSELRDKKVVGVQRFKVNRLEAKVGEQTLTASREKESWKLEGPLAEKLQPSDVEAVLDDLVGLRAEALIDGVQPADLATYGLDQAALELTLTEEGGQPVRVSLGQGTGERAERAYARVEGDATVYELTKYLLEDIRDVLSKKTAAQAPGQGSGTGEQATGAAATP